MSGATSSFSPPLENHASMSQGSVVFSANFPPTGSSFPLSNISNVSCFSTPSTVNKTNASKNLQTEPSYVIDELAPCHHKVSTANHAVPLSNTNNETMTNVPKASVHKSLHQRSSSHQHIPSLTPVDPLQGYQEGASDFDERSSRLNKTVVNAGHLGHIRSNSCVETSTRPPVSGSDRLDFVSSGTANSNVVDSEGNAPKTIVLRGTVLKSNNPFLDFITAEEIALANLQFQDEKPSNDLLDFSDVPSKISQKNQKASEKILQMFDNASSSVQSNNNSSQHAKSTSRQAGYNMASNSNAGFHM